MKKDTLVQFVCFITDLDFSEFITKWEFYADQFINTHPQMTLQEKFESKSKFKYVSQHECPDRDFEFAFMKGRNSGHFPEHKAKVIQAGGYMPLQLESPQKKEKGIVKLMAFISHDENDISFYSQLPLYRHLNIYQAWYESCLYAYVMEFFVEESHAAELLSQLKTRESAESGLYKECNMPGTSKKDIASRKLLSSGKKITEKAAIHH
ncbi:MAG: hypothetical protein ABI675_00855 [Chitinophagaceae bacterium]